MNAAPEFYARLSFGAYRLLLPQPDVALLELSSELRPSLSPGVVGELAFDGRDWPVYSINDDFELAATLAPARYVCALLRGGDGFFGIACDQVMQLAGAGLTLYEVPVCMDDGALLVERLALRGGEPQWCTSGARAERWLGVKESEYHDKQ